MVNMVGLRENDTKKMLRDAGDLAVAWWDRGRARDEPRRDDGDRDRRKDVA
jgi:hypothetical protein